MEKKSSIDPGLLAPILFGALSILGIAAVLFIGRANALRPSQEIASTETPFRYVYLGTEPGLSTLTPEPTATPMLAPTEPPDFGVTPDFVEPPFPTSGSNSSNTLVPPNPAFPTQPFARTPSPTATETIPAVLSIFDDTYYEILYDGEWTSQTNVTDAHQNTLHISFEVENYALFTFVGEQVIVSYQAGPSLGEILITIDGLEFPPVKQSNGKTLSVNWPSPVLVMGTHEIIIEHLSGGSVNIDKITIPDLSTPVPTSIP